MLWFWHKYVGRDGYRNPTPNSSYIISSAQPLHVNQLEQTHPKLITKPFNFILTFFSFFLLWLEQCGICAKKLTAVRYGSESQKHEVFFFFLFFYNFWTKWILMWNVAGSNMRRYRRNTKQTFWWILTKSMKYPRKEREVRRQIQHLLSSLSNTS